MAAAEDALKTQESAMDSAGAGQAKLFESGNSSERNYKSALTKAYQLLSYRSRSEKELREALQKSGFEEETVAAVLAECKRQRYLDDAGFARAFIQNRIRNRPMGRERLALELRQKGIDPETLQAALDEVFTADTVVALADQLAGKQRKKLTTLPPRKAQQKLADFLRRRGFDWETIQTTQLWKELIGRNNDE